MLIAEQPAATRSTHDATYPSRIVEPSVVLSMSCSPTDFCVTVDPQTLIHPVEVNSKP